MFGIDTVILAQVAGVVAYSLLEYWLGKTPKVEAASVLELVINTVIKHKSKVKPPEK